MYLIWIWTCFWAFLVCVLTQLKVFACIGVRFEVWTLRSCFQSDPFQTQISQSILEQRGERFQDGVVKADIAVCGMIKKGFAHPFLCPALVWKCSNVNFNFCSSPMHFIFAHCYMEQYFVLYLSVKYEKFFFMLILTSAVVCPVILQFSYLFWMTFAVVWLNTWELNTPVQVLNPPTTGAVLQLIGSYFCSSTVDRIYYWFSWSGTQRLQLEIRSFLHLVTSRHAEIEGSVPQTLVLSYTFIVKKKCWEN